MSSPGSSGVAFRAATIFRHSAYRCWFSRSAVSTSKCACACSKRSPLAFSSRASSRGSWRSSVKTSPAYGELTSEHELAAAGGHERLEQLDRELAHRRLERGQPLLVEHAVERPAVARMLGRVEVQRRPPARDRVLRDDDPERAREVAGPRARRDDVVVARERPEVPACAARDRALRPEPRPDRVRVARELLVERVEVGASCRRSRVGTRASPTPASRSSSPRRRARSPTCARAAPRASRAASASRAALRRSDEGRRRRRGAGRCSGRFEHEALGLREDASRRGSPTRRRARRARPCGSADRRSRRRASACARSRGTA